jgi:perosamine synthetase
MERLPSILQRKRAIAAQYRTVLAIAPVTFQVALPGTVGSDWLISLLLPEGADRDRVMADLERQGIETRPVFYPAHRMPMYQQPLELPLAESIAARGMSLPSYPDLTQRDVDRVAAGLIGVLRTQGFG